MNIALLYLALFVPWNPASPGADGASRLGGIWAGDRGPPIHSTLRPPPYSPNLTSVRTRSVPCLPPTPALETPKRE